MQDTKPLLIATDFPEIQRTSLSTLQVNLGYLCNLSCTHCHVNAGPKRTELMTEEVIQLIIDCIDHLGIKTLDLTGGAPEMNPHFRWLVEEARKRDVEVIDRCNLTILLEPGYEWLAEFLAANQVEVVASLPCYLEDNVDGQRGKGVYQKSVEALKLLNQHGYGKGADHLPLSLVYNPTGPFLPPPQQALEQDYKRELLNRFDISFDNLYTITNMPISRFGAVLLAKDQFVDYMTLLRNNFSQANLDNVMCKSLVSIDWQGYLYDCDFNQMLDMPLEATSLERPHLRDLLSQSLDGLPIKVADHCYGCTAGQGSSCGGALDED
ncbi:arsenosugar biosynthesis radical SAM (seleno)protein ArsS [Litoribrevibacter euphylliae]|uniref:Arsenosugar biosynthesis radical SAM (Seleno)protein ArsS n=1 Tax=Litoribrevibacter euphylliae TaxID=1834034 RepID=A0ABV7HC92_9GAMM